MFILKKSIKVELGRELTHLVKVLAKTHCFDPRNHIQGQAWRDALVIPAPGGRDRCSSGWNTQGHLVASKHVHSRRAEK